MSLRISVARGHLTGAIAVALETGSSVGKWRAITVGRATVSQTDPVAAARVSSVPVDRLNKATASKRVGAKLCTESSSLHDGRGVGNARRKPLGQRLGTSTMPKVCNAYRTTGNGD